MSNIYRVSCKFFVRANSARDVFDYCKEDNEFTEKHIIVCDENCTGVDVNEVIFEDLTQIGARRTH